MALVEQNQNVDVSVRTVAQDNEDGQTLHSVDPDYKLPKTSSLIIIIVCNILLQISFFIIVSSTNEYAKHLGGSSTFSGVVIGIPTVFSGLTLIPLLKFDKGGYKIPLHVSCGASILGHILYGCAYRANFLYLILIGRIVSGAAFSMWMYTKRYCSDARIVGIRRRTTLAGFLVMGQGLGMSLGPLFGGLLFKLGFKNDVFNGFTSPAWIMAGVWSIFWVCVTLFFEDARGNEADFDIPLPQLSSDTSSKDDMAKPQTESKDADLPAQSSTAPIRPNAPPISYRMNTSQKGVLFCMCWFAMTCFFILGAWESNLPVFGEDSPKFHWTPFSAGNFIAFGGLAAFPFLLLNLFMVRRIEDRKILAFGSLFGLAALLVFLSLLRSGKIVYGSLFMCWWGVALGFNVATTVTVSLLSKQLPPSWNTRTSLAIQYSMYTGRVTGAIWGGSGVRVGMMNYVGVEIAVVGIGVVLFIVLWQDLKAKTG
ncbi:major facilitator superfamily domain-containing protein [Cyathus striatus]|nr:major facilitator superfamily domain-containing protein [Cyathus striatus]